MGDTGNDVLKAAEQQGKKLIKEGTKKVARSLLANPYFWLVMAMILIIIIIIGAMMDVETEETSNTSGMSSAVGTVGTEVIDVTNDDGTINEEKMLELQVALETEYHLVSADNDLNTGNEYKNVLADYDANCEKVKGTYLGFSYWKNNSQTERTPYSNKISGIEAIIYQCVWWARGRACEVNSKEIKISTRAAKDMIVVAANNKYNVGNSPKVNSMVVYSGGTYGHIAYVEGVDTVNQCYYISHAGSGNSWFGIQKIPFNGAPWEGYTQLGFIYLD